MNEKSYQPEANDQPPTIIKLTESPRRIWSTVFTFCIKLHKTTQNAQNGQNGQNGQKGTKCTKCRSPRV